MCLQPQVVADGVATAVDGAEPDRREVGSDRRAVRSRSCVRSAAPHVRRTVGRRPSRRRTRLPAARTGRQHHRRTPSTAVRAYYRRQERTTSVHRALVAAAVGQRHQQLQ